MISRLVSQIVSADRIFICGNGGSAANSIHWANDLIALGKKAQALVADVSTVTAIANDYGYEHIFSRQLRILGKKGDLIVALSGSGRSPNIRRALSQARSMGIATHRVFGAFNRHRGKDLTVMGSDMMYSENAQILILHQVVRCLKDL